MMKLSRWRAKIVTSLLLMTRVLGSVMAKVEKLSRYLKSRFAEG